MKEFTFAILTYNQRSLIVEQLESIKRQVENYGQDYQTDVVLSDDCSTDDTVIVAQKWLEQHKHLFRNIKILQAEKNQGVVKNFIKMISHIDTEYTKYLAGDDYYFSNNIYEATYGKQFLLSPTLQLFGDTITQKQPRWLYKEYLLLNKSLRRHVIRKRLAYQLSLETPGVSWATSLIDEGMMFALRDYKWIEDVPLWNYLLSKKIDVEMTDKPLVVYRMNAGISQDKKHEKVTVFDEEVIKLRQEIQVHMNNRLYRYKRAIAKRIIKYFFCNTACVRKLDESLAEAFAEADDYVASITQAAKSWMLANM